MTTVAESFGRFNVAYLTISIITIGGVRPCILALQHTPKIANLLDY